MSIISYLAVPKAGKMDLLKQKLLNLDDCEFIEAESDEILVVITDTENNYKDQELYDQLKQLHEIQNLTMVFGHNSNEIDQLLSQENDESFINNNIGGTHS
jgi:nitrate reductase NapAB chaperone NapD